MGKSGSWTRLTQDQKIEILALLTQGVTHDTIANDSISLQLWHAHGFPHLGKSTRPGGTACCPFFFYVGDGAAIQYILKPCGAEAVRNVFLMSFVVPIDCGKRYNIAQQQCHVEPVYCV